MLLIATAIIIQIIVIASNIMRTATTIDYQCAVLDHNLHSCSLSPESARWYLGVLAQFPCGDTSSIRAVPLRLNNLVILRFWATLPQSIPSARLLWLQCMLSGSLFWSPETTERRECQVKSTKCWTPSSHYEVLRYWSVVCRCSGQWQPGTEPEDEVRGDEICKDQLFSKRLFNRPSTLEEKLP